MPSISVSNLELYRMWRESEELDLEWLLRRLRGEEPQTEAMKAGEALHEALEHVEEGDALSLVSGDFKFYFTTDAQVEILPCRELKLEKQYGDLTVRGRVDGLIGKSVLDYKSTASFDADRLLEGSQWRFYLDMTDCDTFIWQVFVMSERLYREYDIYQVHKLTQHRYPNLEKECTELAANFFDFTKGLDATGTDWRRAVLERGVQPGHASLGIGPSQTPRIAVSNVSIAEIPGNGQLVDVAFGQGEAVSATTSRSKAQRPKGQD